LGINHISRASSGIAAAVDGKKGNSCERGVQLLPQPRRRQSNYTSGLFIQFILLSVLFFSFGIMLNCNNSKHHISRILLELMHLDIASYDMKEEELHFCLIRTPYLKLLK
jgi:hypothetical protein